MKIPRQLIKVLLAGFSTALFASSAAAGPAVTITFGFTASRVPTMGGTALIALAVLLLVVAYRVLKSEHRTGLNLIAIVSVISAVGLATGGINLISEATAGFDTIVLTDENEGQIEIEEDGFYEVENGTEELQVIQSIVTRADCSIGGPPINGGLANGGMNGGGSFVGECTDSPGTELEPEQYCELAVFCLNI